MTGLRKFETDLGVYLWAAAALCVWIIIEEYVFNLLDITVNTPFRIYLFICSIILVALSVYADHKYSENLLNEGESN